MSNIRKATRDDLKELMSIFESARGFMQQTGNHKQWINGYPQEQLIDKEIEANHCYVYQLEDGTLAGTFCLIHGEDPTYAVIEQGEWLNNRPYATIHRLASNGKVKGVADKCIDWCLTQCANIRIDTHEDNLVMQHILLRKGFSRCGIIYVSNGTPRIAFQKCINRE
ncbi:MAG TPA: GNAT family N-acetyltransferase [Porphyromonadaceae bacterium]|nr:GNAT family N-acetyltransferase [Porphyromonadaceae bacterium]